MLALVKTAFGFLTVFPVGREITGPGRLARSARVFPVVGLGQGILLAGSYSIFALVFHQDLSLALALLAYALSTGGLHLDGLGDTADALAARGGRERRLEVMRDPGAGPSAVAAIAFALGIRYLALGDAFGIAYTVGYAAMLLMPVAGKLSMVMAMAHARAARQEGLGSVFISSIGRAELISALALSCVIMAVPAMPVEDSLSRGWLVGSALILASLYAFTLALGALFDSRFGGQTGDTVGATGEAAEILYVMMVVIWSRLFMS